jgi:hypothetical protein
MGSSIMQKEQQLQYVLHGFFRDGGCVLITRTPNPTKGL